MAMRVEGDSSFVEDTPDTSRRGVLVVPPLAAPGHVVWSLRDKLTDAGYDAHTVYPHSFLNFGIGVEKAIEEAAIKLSDKHDGEPVAGVGWSLGGRQLLKVASKHPGLIDDVHTLGSPRRFIRTNSSEVNVVCFVGRNGRWFDWVVPSFLARGIGNDETVKVGANHFTLPFSSEVFDAITHRLGQPSGNIQRTPLTLVR